tara:strand:+ start:31890 stop:32420 length:531 start_codon:yes stop_codon:yes gene_type:complete
MISHNNKKDFFKLRYHKKITFGLSENTLLEYAGERFNKTYQQYEFLNSYIRCSGPYENTIITKGRFYGFETLHSKIEVFKMYQTTDAGDLLHNISLPLDLDERYKYHMTRHDLCFPVSIHIAVDLYPYYINQIILIYLHFQNKNININMDCFYKISQFLKPIELRGYEIIWKKNNY